MKKIFALALMATSLIACNNAANNTESTDSTTAVSMDTLAVVPAPVITYNEGDVSRRDGKVVIYKNGDWVVVDKSITLDDGTVVSVNGEAKSKDGKVYVIEDGYYVNKAGRFFDKTGTAIENAWDATKAGVKNAAETTKEGLEKAADATKEGLQKTGDAIKKGADKVADKTKEVVEDIKH